MAKAKYAHFKHFALAPLLFNVSLSQVMEGRIMTFITIWLSFKIHRTSKRPGVRFGRGRGRGREQNTFPGAGAGGLAGNYRPGSPYLAGAGAGNGDKPSPGAGNSRRRESRSFPASDLRGAEKHQKCNIFVTLLTIGPHVPP